MSGDVFPEKRKSKNDKKAKQRYSSYKKGGKYRGTTVEDTKNKGKEETKSKKSKKGKKSKKKKK